MRRPLAALFAAALTLAACGGDERDQRLGRASALLSGSSYGTGPACDDPHVVYLRDASGGQVCSGVVLAADVIVTAAHCVADANGSLQDISGLTVGVGGAGCRYGDATIAAAKVHPGWRGQLDGNNGLDLAVLKLSTALSGASPVTLASPALDMQATVSAFGTNGRDDVSQTCTPGKVVIVNTTKGSDVQSTVDMGKQGVCSGDSGGGAFEQGTSKLIGIVSAAAKESEDQDCGRYALIGADWDFVRSAMQSLPDATPVSCTPGQARTCRPSNSQCPSTDDDCRFGSSQCQSDGSWGACTMSTIRVWDETNARCVCTNSCSGNFEQDPETCLCVDLCGNGSCMGGETHQNCPADCPDRCGDGTCEFWQGETATTCPQDCSQCGDGRCTGNETPTSCPADCAGCGDGVCSITESAMSCPADCGWGSGGGAGGGGGGGGGGGSTDPCDDPQDSFWTDLFGEYAFEAYLFYCGVEA